MDETPRISSVEAVAMPFPAIRVTWDRGPRAGRTELVDLGPLIQSLKFYRPLRSDPALFQDVRVDDTGTFIFWGDEDLDMAASSVARLAAEMLTADDFRGFLQRNRLTHVQAAAELGRSRRAIENYLAGAPIPRVVALAVRGIEAMRSKSPA